MSQQHYGNSSSRQQDGIISNNDKTHRDLDEISCQSQQVPAASGSMLGGETSKVLASAELYSYSAEPTSQLLSDCSSLPSSSLHPCDSLFAEGAASSSSSNQTEEFGLQTGKSKQSNLLVGASCGGDTGGGNGGGTSQQGARLLSSNEQQVRLNQVDQQQISLPSKELSANSLANKSREQNASQQSSTNVTPQHNSQYQISQSMTGFHQQQQLIFGSSVSNGNALDDQQQDHSTSAHQQLDLVSEECGGLFVEYQTSRNSLGGCLEELNSLNVTNCDSDTLEEQINMLSSDDCFTTSDDLHDFGIGGSSDNFLNMLFMNTGGSQPTNVCSTGQSGFQSSTNMTSSALGCPTDNNNPSVSLNQEHQFAIPALTGSEALTSRGEIASLATSEKDLLEHGRKSTSKARCTTASTAKTKRTSKGKASPSRALAKRDCSNGLENLAAERIATTNNNKRLLPKPKGASRRNSKTVSSTRVSSPSSVSSAVMSPSSSSHSVDFETPYKLQLDNLRKKLRMDVAPATSFGKPSLGSSTSLCNNGRLVDDNQHQITHKLATAGTGAPNSVAGAQQSHLIFQTTDASRTTTPNQQQQVYLTTQTELGQKIRAGPGPCLAIQQPTNSHADQTAAIGPSAPTAYLIAKPLFEQSFQSSTGGTIYLRTQNGLIPLSATTSDRRATGLSLMKSTSNNVVREQSSLQFVGASSVHPNSNLSTVRQAGFVIQAPGNHVEDHGQIVHLASDNTGSNLISHNAIGQPHQPEHQQLEHRVVQAQHSLHQSAISDSRMVEANQHYQTSVPPSLHLQHQQHREHQQLTANQILIHGYKDIPIEPSSLGAATKPMVDNRINVSN